MVFNLREMVREEMEVLKQLGVGETGMRNEAT